MYGKTGPDMTTVTLRPRFRGILPAGPSRCGLADVQPALSAKKIMVEPACRCAARRGAVAGAGAADVAAPPGTPHALPRVVPYVSASVLAGSPPSLRVLCRPAALAAMTGCVCDVENGMRARKKNSRPGQQPACKERRVRARLGAISDVCGLQADVLPASGTARSGWGKIPNPPVRAVAGARLSDPSGPARLPGVETARCGQSTASAVPGLQHASFITRLLRPEDRLAPALVHPNIPTQAADPRKSGATQVLSGRHSELRSDLHLSVKRLPERKTPGTREGALRKSAPAGTNKSGFYSVAAHGGRAVARQGAAPEIALSPRLPGSMPISRRDALLQAVPAPMADQRQAGLQGFGAGQSAGRPQAAVSGAQEKLSLLAKPLSAMRGAAQIPPGLSRIVIAPAKVASVLTRADAAPGATPERTFANGAALPASLPLPASIWESRRTAAPKSVGADAARAASTPALTANFSFQLNGISDADLARRVMTALESSKGDVERLLSEIVHNQMRVSYAG